MKIYIQNFKLGDPVTFLTDYALVAGVYIDCNDNVAYNLRLVTGKEVTAPQDMVTALVREYVKTQMCPACMTSIPVERAVVEKKNGEI